MENKNGSKSNLNESVLPLLDDEVSGKEKIELKSKSSNEESNETSKNEDDGTKNENSTVDELKKKKEEERERKRQKKLEEEERKKQLKLEKQKQKEEEKEKKKQQKAEKKSTMENGGTTATNIGNRLNQFTVGINLLDRDERSINDHINISFEDIIGEPDSTQGFDSVYQLSFGLFQFVRFWLYRILMAVISLPLAFIWAIIFTLLSLISVWIITPGFRVMDILFFFVHRVWACLVRTFLDPIFTSISLIRQQQPKSYHPSPNITNSGRSLLSSTTIFKNGIKYNKVNSNETVETYKTTSNNGEDQLSNNEQVTVAIG